MPCIVDFRPGSDFEPSPLNRDNADEEFWFVTDDWVWRSRRALDEEKYFEALIYSWIPFNAWVGRVIVDRTKSNRDRCLVASAAMDVALSRRFCRLLLADGRTAQAAHRFRSLWPVFKARSLSDHKLDYWRGPENEPRTAFRTRCFGRRVLGSSDLAPSCFQHHQLKGAEYDPEHVPLDWAHTLHAIYMVRCSLFHGGKSFRSGGDAEFVEPAAVLLGAVWADRECPR